MSATGRPAGAHQGQGSEEYRDPVEFFRRTFLTASLKQLLAGSISRLSGGAGDPVVQMQTNFGGGKTAIGAEIVRRMLDKHLTAVVGWVAHRNELLDQAADALERVGVESGSWAKLPADRRCWDDWAGKLLLLLLSSSARSWPAEKLAA